MSKRNLNSQNLRFLQSFQCVRRYLFATYGVEIKTQRGLNNSCYDPNSKNIIMAQNLLPRRRLCTLLHEAGHMLLEYALKRRKLYKRIFSKGYGNWEICNKNSNYKIDVIREEILAWEKGWELARNLELRISRENYNIEMRKSLITYVQWGAGFWGIVK